MKNIYRNHDYDIYKNLSDDEFIEMVMDKYQPFTPKYVYKGLTLRQYCLKNDLSYYSIVSFVKRKLAENSKKTIDELINEGINTINRYGIVYYYKGIPLKDYAKEHNLNVATIRVAVLKKAANSNRSFQEIVDECVESCDKLPRKYYYNDMSLFTYCKKAGISYNTVIKKYLNEYQDKKDLSVTEAIKEIVDYYLLNPPNKYFFNNQSLANFCDVNNYPYLAIYRRIKILESKDLDREDIITTAIKKYEDKLQINKINEIFKNLKDNKIWRRIYMLFTSL